MLSFEYYLHKMWTISRQCYIFAIQIILLLYYITDSDKPCLVDNMNLIISSFINFIEWLKLFLGSIVGYGCMYPIKNSTYGRWMVYYWVGLLYLGLLGSIGVCTCVSPGSAEFAICHVGADRLSLTCSIAITPFASSKYFAFAIMS